MYIPNAEGNSDSKTRLQLARGGPYACHEAVEALCTDVERIEELIQAIDLSDVLDQYNWPTQVRRWLWREKYYKGLVAYCEAFQVKKVLELGTCTGASTACLARGAEEVVTCDLTDWSIADAKILSGKTTFVKCEHESDVLELDYAQFDLIFVDLAHRGLLERLVHLKLLKDGYQGDVFWDDIHENVEMRRFWLSIKEPKLELDWHEQGFGVVRYRKETEAAQ
jgi:hypothetical protein